MMRRTENRVGEKMQPHVQSCAGRNQIDDDSSGAEYGLPLVATTAVPPAVFRTPSSTATSELKLRHCRLTRK